MKERFKYLDLLHIINIIMVITMVSITLSVPKEIKGQMEEFQDINWSAVAREAIRKKIVMLQKFKEFSKNSDFSEKDAIDLGRELKRSTSK